LIALVITLRPSIIGGRRSVAQTIVTG